MSGSTILRFVLLIFSLTFFTICQVRAQPGYRETRTPEEIKQALIDGLEQANEQIRKHPEQYAGYDKRSRIYAAMGGQSADLAERSFFMDKAFADMDKAMELDPDFWPRYAERARLKNMDPLKNFEEIRSDYLTAIRLIEKSGPYTNSDYDVRNLYNNLSYLYRHRGETLVNHPRLITADMEASHYSAWDDFETAIAYAKKGVDVLAHWWNVTAAILNKGDLAYKKRDYKRALAAFQSDEEHLGKEYASVCEKAYSQEVCRREQKDILLTFSIRRGRALLKLGRAEEALKELNTYFEKAYHHDCQDIFRLRAEAHRALGNAELAGADEESAKKKSSSSCPFDIPR